MSEETFIRQERSLEPFSQVVLADYGKLYVSQGENSGLVIEADEALMDLISSRVRDGKLVLRIDEPFVDRMMRFFVDSWRGKHLVYRLTVKEIDRLELHGAAKIVAQPLRVDQFNLTLTGAGEVQLEEVQGTRLKTNISGTGRIEVAGKVHDQEVLISGAGKYEGRQLECERCQVTLSGTGKAVLHVEDDLEISISGLGKVEYYGSPKLRQRISGVGKVERMGAAY